MFKHADTVYMDLVQDILENGEKRPDRTGTGTLSLFGPQIQFDLRDGFPLLTTKKVFFTGVKAELLWILSGSTNNNDLEAMGTTIWQEWAKPDGDLGPIYGKQWRSWQTFKSHPWESKGWALEDKPIDQIQKAIDLLNTDPHSRRNVVSAWNVADLDKMALNPCHAMFQLYASDEPEVEHLGYKGFVDLKMFQRSADVALGVPFNIASYALLLEMFGKASKRIPRRLTITFGDVHAYLNHLDGLKEQRTRIPLEMPEIHIENFTDIFAVRMQDIKLINYKPHPSIPFAVSV